MNKTAMFFVTVVLGVSLAAVVYFYLMEFRRMRAEKEEKGKYHEKFFYMLGFVIGLPITLLINLTLIPEWVTDEPYKMFLTPALTILPMLLCAHLTVLLCKKYINPDTASKASSKWLSLLLLLAMLLYIVYEFARHYLAA